MMSARVIELPDNLIGLDDREKLERLGSYEIGLGRATRFYWGMDENRDPVFEIYHDGMHEKLLVRIRRKREINAFYAEDARGQRIFAGALVHVMAVLDQKLAREHGKNMFI